MSSVGTFSNQPMGPAVSAHGFPEGESFRNRYDRALGRYVG